MGPMDTGTSGAGESGPTIGGWCLERLLEVPDFLGNPIFFPGLDLLISDLVMPGEGGQDLARSLRQAWPRLPVLFISGYSPTDVVDLGSQEASWPFLQRPFQRGLLLAKVEALLAASRTEA